MVFSWTDGRRREPLPIDDRLGEILDLSAANQVVIVEAETGAGKTTRIGQAIVVTHQDREVWMTLPRRSAVRMNGKRIASELGQGPGGLVGWRLFGDAPTESERTRLHLRIDQSLANAIRSNDGRLPEGTIVVDEAHERSVKSDTLLGLIKEALPRSPKTNVLVISATLDTAKFSQFFGDAPVVSVKGRCYPVLTEVVRLGHGEHHSQGAARAAGEVLKRFFAGSLLVPTVDERVKQAVRQGTVIVLLPGKDDIKSVMASIRREVEAAAALQRVEILPYSAESTFEEEEAVQRPVPKGMLRFVCATEVVRTSVTLRDVVGVIDSLQVKRKLADKNGVAHLTKVPVSRAEADQGKGRAGRTQPGFYMPISFNSEYEGLDPYPLPAILREPITNVALQVASLGRSIRDFAFIDPPAIDNVDVALRRLCQVGALDKQERITAVGELLVRFPIDPERAKVLVTADKLGVLPEAVVVTATLETEGFFHSPKEEPGKTAKVIIDETIARLILARVEKRILGWARRSEPIDPKTVDFTDLPNWVNPQTDGQFEVDCSGDDFPLQGLKGVADLIKRAWAGESKSDFVAIVRAYRAFKVEERRLRSVTVIDGQTKRLRPLSGRERDDRAYQWCLNHFINVKRLGQAEDAMAQIKEEVENSPLRLENDFGIERDFDTTALTKALASGLTDHVARSSDGSYRGPLGDFSLSYQSACQGNPALVLVGGVHKIPTKRGRGLLLADVAAPLEFAWLLEVMPHLCTSKRLGDHRYDPERKEVVETKVHTFIDTEIGRETVRSENDVASRNIFCAWVMAQMMAS